MKKQITLLLSALVLASCGGGGSSSASSSAASSAQSSGSEGSSSASSSITSSEPSSSSEEAPSYSQRSYEETEWELNSTHITNPLADDFAFGVDISSVAEVEQGGGKFYGEDGQEGECYQILADGGANYARIRLWNDPFDLSEDHNRYGGGTNDIETDIALARRAQAAGLQILIDFHYSDSWVDPGKYWAPKAWKGLDYDAKREKLYEFTRDSLQAFKDAGITVHAVQLGNEINPGIAGVKSNSYQRIGGFIASGSQAARSVFPHVKTIVHYTNINNPAIIFSWLGYLQKYQSESADYEGALPDIVGLSYYPYWHGSLDNLQYVMDKIANDFDRDVMVVETSWGYTDETAEYCNNTFNTESLGKVGGYATSPQAQVTVVSDIVDCLSKVPNGHGKGIFYWEPAWLPNKYSGWISQYGAYYNDKGNDWTTKYHSQEELDAVYDPEYYGWSAWANQAWFDYSGHALPSVSTYRHIRVGDHVADESYVRLLNPTAAITLNISEEWSMPATAAVVTNFDAYRQVAVDWNADEVAQITQPGYYTVHGSVAGLEYEVLVRAEKNFIKDANFEKQGCTTESAVIAPWDIETTKKYKEFGDCHIEAKSELGDAGNQYLHWYSTDALEFTLSQNLGEVPAGDYVFGFTMLSSFYDAGGADGKVNASTLWYTINGGERIEFDIREEFLGFGMGAHVIEVPEIQLAETGTIVIGFSLDATKGAWGHADDFYFSAVIPEE